MKPLGRYMQRFVCKIAMLGSLVLITGQAEAAPCYNCQTIHNSSDGLPMRFDSGAQPLPLLLRGDCIDCHTGLNTAANLDTPKVYSASAPVYIWGNTIGAANTTLAGGSFYYVDLNESFGHNVRENPVAGVDSVFGNTPPGGPALVPDGFGNPLLQCAGTNGCHGDTAVSGSPLFSLDGAHHINETGALIDGSTVAKSYRFLDGVLGWEDDDWQFTSSATDHNRYVGQDRTLVTQVSATTISGFCAGCHGFFHNTTSGAGAVGIGFAGNFTTPWLRHPTDYDMADLPPATEYAGYATYKTRVPVARTTTTLSSGSNDAVGDDQAVVMCLSCHLAHGSPYYASLRWNYRAWPGADPLTGAVQDGCQICHTSKN